MILNNHFLLEISFERKARPGHFAKSTLTRLQNVLSIKKYFWP
jgi:hypothetical protein